MKTGAPILVSFAVGALVVLALHTHGTGAQAAGGPPSPALAAPLIAEPAAARAAGIAPSPAKRVQVDSPAR
ncbi:MAG TPA: hypothetical protein VHI53_09975, partial [Gaiellaceae bacterium]|nr:hypothetical protein [Gaiellaceae bacterium]